MCVNVNVIAFLLVRSFLSCIMPPKVLTILDCLLQENFTSLATTFKASFPKKWKTSRVSVSGQQQNGEGWISVGTSSRHFVAFFFVRARVHTCVCVCAAAVKIDLYANALTGTVPANLAKLHGLTELDVHDNFFVGRMPQALCDKKSLTSLISDCWGQNKEVQCDCCTICCEGLPKMRCVDMQTKQEVIVGATTKKK